MVPVEHYRGIAALQRQIFGERVKVHNTVQTNLTIMPEKLISFLEDREFFQGIGVSFDVYGDKRVDKRGQSSTQKVLENFERLRETGVIYGAIAVLARNTLPHLDAIVRFYETIGVPFRILPFYLSAYDAQIDEHAISQHELVEAMKTTFDIWLTSENAIAIDPLEEYITHAMNYMSDHREKIYDRGSEEIVFVVDVDGSVSGMSDTYDLERTYGNLTTMTMDDVLSSPRRQIVLDETRERMDRYCGECPYFGHCPGHFVAEASPAQRKAMDRDGCPARAIIDHIVDQVSSLETSDTVLAMVRQDRARLNSGILAV
jgi:uncharacterized protein